MAWIESHQALKNHPKVARLARATGWNIPETIGKLHIFWWWCLDYATDGRLEQFDHSTIAGVFGVETECEQFVQLLILSKFIDSTPEIRVHDWWDYAGRFLQVRYKRKPKIWKEIKRFYGHSIQRTNNRTTTEQQPTNNHKPNQPNLTRPNLTSLSPASTSARGKIVFPMEWKPEREEMEQWRQHGIADPWVEFAMFRDHALANDRRCKDWPAAWRNWCRKELRRKEERHGLSEMRG